MCTCTYMYMHIHACLYTRIYIHTNACIWMFSFMMACITIPSVWKGGPMCENKASRGHGRICTARSRLHACSCNFWVCVERACASLQRASWTTCTRAESYKDTTLAHTHTHILHGHAGTTASLRIHRESVLAQAAVRCALLPVHLLGLCVFVCVCVSFVVRAFLCMCISVWASVFVCVSLFEADTDKFVTTQMEKRYMYSTQYAAYDLEWKFTSSTAEPHSDLRRHRGSPFD